MVDATSFRRAFSSSDCCQAPVARMCTLGKPDRFVCTKCQKNCNAVLDGPWKG